MHPAQNAFYLYVTHASTQVLFNEKKPMRYGRTLKTVWIKNGRKKVRLG